MKITRLMRGYTIRLSDSEFELMEQCVSHGVSNLNDLGQGQSLSPAAKRALNGRFSEIAAMRIDKDKRRDPS